MLTWSTDHLPPPDRFAYWREERGKFLGGRIELALEDRAAFEGHYAVRQLGSVAIADIRASAYHVTRGEADIADKPGDAICICQQIRGGGMLVAGGREDAVSAGAITIGHFDRPYVNIPAEQHDFVTRIVKIPFARFADLIDDRHDLALRPVAPVPGAATLLATYLAAYVRQAPDLTLEAAELATDTLVRLALLAWHPGGRPDPSDIVAIRRARLEHAYALIERAIGNPMLSPSVIADALGVSVRQLHMLFETTDTSFSLYVRRRRLERARRLLTMSPTLTVTEIAFASGFESLATFFRCFGDAHGCTPGDVRRAAT